MSRARLAIGACLCALAGAAAAQALARFEQDGVGVRLSASAPLREGADLGLVLNLFDSASGAALRGARPAAWLDRAQAGAGAQSCKQKAASFVGGSWLNAPVLDLNAYYVLALNAEPSITVINPLGGFGGSKMLALVALHAPGADWLQSGEQRMLVSMPLAGEVALVDTRSWTVIGNTAVGAQPGRMVAQPGVRAGRVWVATDDGVAVLEGADGKLAGRVATGAGPHDIAFSADGATAFVTNGGAGSVALIDAATLRQGALVPSGAAPASVAWSDAAALAYVTHADGAVVALERDGRVAARMQAAPGLGQIRFAPGGRFALVLNGGRGELLVLDAASNKIVQQARVGQGPDQIAFSERMAYIRRHGSAEVQLVPLEGLGRSGEPLQVGAFAGGQLAPGAGAGAAAAMAPAPNGAAMLVANPADQAIYYYQEGMAAPLGSMRNYSRTPRAVMVVDRSLQERAAGEYRVEARMPAAGDYELVLYLDTPRMLQCVSLHIAAAPDAPAAPRRFDIRLAAAPAPLAAHRAQQLRFRISDAGLQQPVAGVGDLQVLVFDAPGVSQRRLAARELGDGIYSVQFSPGAAGLFYLHFQAPSLGLRWSDQARLTVTATE
jgi:YVTN family beta-propeller protein